MIIDEAKNICDDIINWRRDLHKIPEIGLFLPETRKYICNVLDEMGLEYKLYKASSGIEIIIKGCSQGKTIALRSDMDALPIVEETNDIFASTNGAMHACGHDAHMAILLGAIKLLNENRDKINGNIKCIFQPGEEGAGGALEMLKEGVLENPKVDAILGIHVTNSIQELYPGTIGLRKGVIMAASDSFDIEIYGRGGHISDVNSVINPIYTTSLLALKIQDICKKYSSQKVAVSLGTIHGGNRSNIVPDKVKVQGSLRTYDEILRKKIVNEIIKTCNSIQQSSGCVIRFSLEEANGVVYNNEEIVDNLINTTNNIFSKADCIEIKTDIMASEDISYFFNERKGAYIHLGCGFDKSDENFPLHNSKFRLNENILWKGSAILAQGAMDWLSSEVKMVI